ncbi:LPS assembly protein LptD [Aliihoeflea aestuarii]|uniref:LPS-assembly protein LptD n=1 Tax=Aliihoeflea aestuarii TaxID=453840 RepID=UPI0020947137|nr:LPS-assembly protein LptD [Aliihoeflea aestuarii]MCO6392764.1 LPS assembly protein LptD [Aliihoeflea aestuarii]
MSKTDLSRRLLGATAVVALLTTTAPLGVLPAAAQAIDLSSAGDPSADMLLEADTLIYDNDRNRITAVGSVQIEYDGNRLVAQRVTYDRATSRLIASGGVEIIDPDGTRFQSDEIDVTDDFADAFVRTLRVETPDRVYFGADRAERRDGAVTEFERGVYTACEPCEENPDKSPVWNIKAQKIIWNGETKTVRFESARFEFLGVPLAWLPAFEIADPTVERKSGFLFPTYGSSERLGQYVRVPYYIALSPTYDATVYASGYTHQGFLGEAEFRQRFDNGEYNLKIAGISQRDPGQFLPDTVDAHETGRGLIASRGNFAINPRWQFGWDGMIQTDKNFGYTYDIEQANAYRVTSQVYLTGLNGRNFFDLRAYSFQTQEAALDFLPDGTRNPLASSPLQPVVLPSFDYSLTPDTPIAGGELTIDVNSQALWRDRFDGRDPGAVDGSGGSFPSGRGLDGGSGRLTAEAEWKRTFITPGGLVLTPMLHARQDAIGVHFGDGALGADPRFGLDAVAGAQNASTDIRSAYYRSMATAGLEARWPILFSTSSSTHILEPTAQLFARPNEPYGNTLGIPNEDAQSLVFDATNLFQRDKFSGYDRIEGGTRANVGLRYTGDLGGGWGASAIVGQSYHLAGQNPFASPDLVYAGAYSGLEEDVSDFVGMVGLSTPVGVSVAAGARFDKDDFAVQRTDVAASYTSAFASVSAQYAFIEAQPAYGFSDDRHEVRVGGSAQVHEYWRVFANATFDLNTSNMVQRGIGFAYDDDCFGVNFTYAENRSNFDNEVLTRDFGVNITLRTLGDFGRSTSSGGTTTF